MSKITYTISVEHPRAYMKPWLRMHQHDFVFDDLVASFSSDPKIYNELEIYIWDRSRGNYTDFKYHLTFDRDVFIKQKEKNLIVTDKFSSKTQVLILDMDAFQSTISVLNS